MKEIETKQGRIYSQGMRPAMRPKFHAGDFGAALTAAIRSSAVDFTPRYIYSVSTGYRIEHAMPAVPTGQRVIEVRAVYDSKAGGYYCVQKVTFEA